MAYPKNNTDAFFVPKEMKRSNEDIDKMSLGVKETPDSPDWSSDDLSKRMQVKKRIPVEIQIELTGNDIFKWINDCKDPELLKALSHTALRLAAALENPNDK